MTFRLMGGRSSRVHCTLSDTAIALMRHGSLGIHRSVRFAIARSWTLPGPLCVDSIDWDDMRRHRLHFQRRVIRMSSTMHVRLIDDSRRLIRPLSEVIEAHCWRILKANGRDQ
jgi:hypothetical protein